MKKGGGDVFEGYGTLSDPGYSGEVVASHQYSG